MSLEDALAMRDSVVGYAQTYDSRDHDGLAAVLAESCRVTMEGGRFDGMLYSGREAVLDWLAGTWPQTPPCVHFTGNTRIWNDASGEAGSTDYVFVSRQADGTITLSGAGRYRDRFSRAADGWVIEERTVRMLGYPEA
jgi:3-phenylpropionate/cinnamic acid dioxygenase small subunit